MNNKTTVRLGIATIGMVLATACSNPEAECRSGVEQMKSRLVGVVGSAQHQREDDPVVQAHTTLDIAQNQLAAGNHKGCLESLEQARVLLNRGTRTNR